MAFLFFATMILVANYYSTDMFAPVQILWAAVYGSHFGCKPPYFSTSVGLSILLLEVLIEAVVNIPPLRYHYNGGLWV